MFGSSHRSAFILTASLLVGMAGCGLVVPGASTDDGPIAEGISARLGEPLPSASAEQMATFARGKAVAERRFDLADGLGPAFNLVSCAGCHEKPTSGGGAGLYRNFLLAGRETADGAFLFSESAGNAGGVIRALYYGIEEAFRPAIPEDTTIFAQRNPIPFFGVGLLAELDEASILANADPDDTNGDGISGRPNFDRGFVGRFGRKAQTVSIEGFIRGPLFNHLGVTSVPLTDEQRAQLPVDSSRSAKRSERLAQAAAEDGPNFDDDGVPDPELSPQELFDLVSFAMLLAAPEVEVTNEQTDRGRLLFRRANCAGCHVPRLDGPRGALPVYSDLLLHDMGSDLADGLVMGEASGSEFRTQPLWGIAAVGPYLHDGRAMTLEEAILAHGGEAGPSRATYNGFSTAEKADLLAFLQSLGGQDQVSGGLLEPDAPVPAVGAYGGPLRTLTEAEMARFERGRAIYDREHGQSDGIGGLASTSDDAPRFNGDSCRACHFDPVLGGAGPRDVNVMRHCTITADGTFLPPNDTPNTILHRFTRINEPPAEPAPAVNFFEHRQTPHTFGLGLIDAIAEATITANVDPADANADGISGRAHVLGDGRIGRFGWKADVPSVSEFIRDAMAAEIGLTMAAQDGLTFGITRDDDGVPDPELPLADAEDLAFFINHLAGPPRQEVPADQQALVNAGEALFASIGCTNCHLPALASDLGPVPLYSDLLLHDVMPAGRFGVESGVASQSEFRTAPLWGLSQTAPYFHSGEADTIDEAIRLHDGEAKAIRTAYEALDDDNRAALLAFLGTL